MTIGARAIVPFTCALCGARFGELDGRKCLSCGALACRRHFVIGWLKGWRGICSKCVQARKPPGLPSSTKK